MRKKLKNTRDYSTLLGVVKTLGPVFTCLEFQTAAGIKTKWNAYCALYHMNDQGLVYRQKTNGKTVRWSLSPFPEEGPKKPLGRVFTTKEYGEYYNLTDPHRMLYRAAERGMVFRVGRKIDQGQPLLWSFNPADAGSELALNKAIASDIIPSAVKDPFANVFR